MFVNLVRSGCAVMQSDNATEPHGRLDVVAAARVARGRPAAALVRVRHLRPGQG